MKFEDLGNMVFHAVIKLECFTTTNHIVRWNNYFSFLVLQLLFVYILFFFVHFKQLGQPCLIYSLNFLISNLVLFLYLWSYFNNNLIIYFFIVYWAEDSLWLMTNLISWMNRGNKSASWNDKLDLEIYFWFYNIG